MDMQPGQVNIPHNNSSGPVENPTPTPPTGEQPATLPTPQPASMPAAPDTSPSFAPSAQAPLADSATGAPAPGQEADWQYTQEVAPMGDDQPLPEDVSWTASEFVEHPKSVGWYGLLTLAGLVLAAVDYFVTKDVISTGVIVIAAALFGIYAGHKPRTQEYHLSPQGLQIGEKMYTFGSFKAFSVAEEGSSASIIFTPLGRFAPALTIYVGQDMEDQVLDYLSIFLPFEKRRSDAVDGLLRRIRF